MSQSISLILLAGGIGSRMGAATPKQFLLLKGKPVALHSLELFASFDEIAEIIVVCAPEHQPFFSGIRPLSFALPGERRQDSLWNGLQKISTTCDLVCVHDAARPCLQRSDFEKLLDEAREHPAVALATPVKYTIKQTGENGFVTTTLDRANLWEIQTPQIAPLSLLKQGFKIAQERNLTVSDDLSLVELTGYPVKLVTGSSSNIKLTTPEDWAAVNSLACTDTSSS
ncbi:MAG: 2-C-methyl-D-erythritol 4-phosphate cytidylyltransferase [Chlamydiales bacterium]|nr:2-C-methyl-D-erythritol 4-phosphate cytidylyltransferase [Chlamydiales bacterium]